MSGHTFRSQLIAPRAIQVTKDQFHRADFFMRHQGLGDIIKEGAERVRESQIGFNNRAARVASDTYDMSSIYWALGISVALFLIVTLLRNK